MKTLLIACIMMLPFSAMAGRCQQNCCDSPQVNNTIHHKPGYFFCCRHGIYYPTYQYIWFDQKHFDPAGYQEYKKVFYRYYKSNGMSAEYYIP